MIYHDLAEYYDDLVKDEEATLRWADLTEDVLNRPGCSILELACGSAEISCELARRGYKLMATDLSEDMLNKAKAKNGAETLRFMPLDMTSFDLNEKGVLIFDMHTPDRLEEFSEEFIEEGLIDDVPYQWTIMTHDDQIHHHFAFWKDGLMLQEFHVQRVFNLNDILSMLHAEGFETEVLVDFDQDQNSPGEKYFVIAKL
ncbi:MAG: class I SAM-dependent methyltransferase [Erysipelotrichaceae bacterium]|nr:class I SAM-dependent methyltransferase [Erysipelotrichaceae bacterium]